MNRHAIDADTRAFLCDMPRLRRFRDRLRRDGRRVVRAEAIWAAFLDVYPDLPPGLERRVWLLTVLEELVARGEITLPVPHGTQWDRTSDVALPTSVSLIVAQMDGGSQSEWRQFPWHPRLQWIFELRNLAADQFEFLRRVNEGLVKGWFEQSECFKYRSLQLTGDEKRLEVLLRGRLFEPGCLTLELLGCESDALPLASEHLSPKPSMLVFENAAPFMLARSIAAKTSNPQFGRLAYGAGKQVLKAVKYFSMIRPAVTEILYIGDLDPEGLKIATDLQTLSHGIPVRPASHFHVAMLKSAAALGSPNGWPLKDDQPSRLAEAELSFLEPGLRVQIAAIFAAGRRIPEEVLSHADMERLLNQ